MTSAIFPAATDDEREFGHGPALWTADPDVCCAAFQLGACPHTEDPSEWGEFDLVEINAQDAAVRTEQEAEAAHWTADPSLPF